MKTKRLTDREKSARSDLRDAIKVIKYLRPTDDFERMCVKRAIALIDRALGAKR